MPFYLQDIDKNINNMRKRQSIFLHLTLIVPDDVTTYKPPCIAHLPHTTMHVAVNNMARYIIGIAPYS